MLNNFRSYRLAVSFYQSIKAMRLPPYLKSQLLRAASSIALNLAEGSAKSSPIDQKRFYEIALGSLRECQAIFQLEANNAKVAIINADILAANIYKLIKTR